MLESCLEKFCCEGSKRTCESAPREI